MSRLLCKRIRVNTKDCYCYSSAIIVSSRYLSSGTGERLRVAVVGGGCAGLSSALHLAPLVDAGIIASPIDVYDTADSRKDREIGVGIWSTALDPFLATDRASHQFVYDEMTSHGSWLGDVGYRTTNGKWLAKSRLPTSREQCQEMSLPALLFLREKDMLKALQKAVHWEQHRGTIQVHCDGDKTRVDGLYEESSQPWSTQLLLKQQAKTERDYHLIIAADGTNSTLRKTYGGHDNVTRRLIGTQISPALTSPIDLPPVASMDASWDELRQQEATLLQDRGYTVFRGNAALSTAAIGSGSSVSFQTWGEGKSMRFATIPMFYPGPVPDKREERHVWFITTDDEEIIHEPDAAKRRAILLETFKEWHPEVCQIVAATPPDEILMERAVAHRHCMGPVLNTNKVIQQIRGKRPPNSGEGPCMVFMGDAYMTVDPILAQGFTLAMEGAFALRKSIEQSCIPFGQDPSFAFDPFVLRRELQDRHDARTDRMVCLLRATELVQALGQPTGAAGAFNTRVLRPLTRLLPNFIKRPFFDAVLKYSLGLSQGKSKAADPPPIVAKADDPKG